MRFIISGIPLSKAVSFSLFLLPNFSLSFLGKLLRGTFVFLIFGLGLANITCSSLLSLKLIWVEMMEFRNFVFDVPY